MSGISTYKIDSTVHGHRVGCFDLTQVRFKSTITEATAFAVVKTTLEVAHKDGGGPIAVGVVDATGELIAFLRNDDAPLRAIKLAIMKAYTSARFGKTTLALQQTLEASGRPLVEYGDGMLTALAGGIPLVANGEFVGGMGVSGRLPKDDHELALSVVNELIQLLGHGEMEHVDGIGDQLEGGNLR